MTEDPGTYIHGNQKGTFPRVRINPTIDIKTESQLRQWHLKRVSFGEIIDQLTQHALKTGFTPKED